MTNWIAAVPLGSNLSRDTAPAYWENMPAW
jgi:hypothetical protein